MKKQTSDTLRMGLLLSTVGGFTDAYTFFIRGKVLANAQTGNIVFLGLRLIEGRWHEAFFYFLPIAAFSLGILIAEFIREKFRDSGMHWRQIVLLIEIVILALCAFVPQGDLDVFVNIAVSFMCSLQVQSFRKTNGSLSVTTMCTGNLRSGTENLYYFLKTRNVVARKSCIIYFGLILFFVIGVIMGAFFTEWFQEMSILVCCVILLTVFGIMFKDEI